MKNEVRPRLTKAEIEYILHLLNREKEILDMLPKRPVYHATPKMVELYRDIQQSEVYAVKYLTRKFSRLLFMGEGHRHTRKGIWDFLALKRIPGMLQKKEELMRLVEEQQREEELERAEASRRFDEDFEKLRKMREQGGWKPERLKS